MCRHVLSSVKALAAHDADRIVGLDGRRMELGIPMAEPREPSKTEREVHLSRSLEACLEWWQRKERRALYWSMWTLDT